MQKNNCIILGGGGFIGQNLAKYLSEDDYNVTIYDRNLKNKYIPNKKIVRIEGDFFKEDNFSEIVKNKDTVIHLISSVSPSSSMNDIYTPYKNDVIKTLELLECCKSLGIKRIIFLSSGGTVYGNTDDEALKEDSPTYPINNYGIMKLTIEKILLMYNKIYGMENIILRVSNPYGKGQNPMKRIGAVSVFMDKIINQNPITLYGNGDIVRDYIEISDVCNAITLSLNYKIKSNVQPVFNVGTGKGISLMEIIKEIELISQSRAQIVHYEERAIDAKINVLEMSKSKRELGFIPKVDIRTGIARLFEERKNMKDISG
ncbi:MULTISPECIES: NAD-dependent epimerase/dehydratase family protein [Paenibacillus]|uniref:NAD-dependent epimerase/dehydratase family protein n=1 Tax=Paenibacillus TaxID=44249 RepID=UPI001916864C|nr:NAD-dependent epimerase/dehydratase family protein [Paenibacillus sp. EPM92]